ETVALTGESGGALAPMADYTLKVPSSITSHIQEGHLCLYHYICREIEAICAAKLGNMEVAV
ncbi:MAG: hypothetical protein HOI80_06055, partial [Alphaproteobacteria bacterium]|nr:hypothetical protein [Alphaproteobacteria bacterium]